MSPADRQRPIIILGAARSGTKFLRDTLAASNAVACTPYDLNYVWRYGNEAFPNDELPAATCTPDVRARIVKDLYRAAGIEHDDKSRLLEKTVSNTLRLPFVYEVFPDADFVHILRDGRDVVASSYAQWNAGSDWRYLLRKARSFPWRHYRYALWYLGRRLAAGSRGSGQALWGVRYAGIEQDLAKHSVAVVCARQWVASVTAVRAASSRLSSLRYREIRYEDLVASEEALSTLVDWLGLKQRDAVLARYRHTLRADNPGRPWSESVPAEDFEQVSRILGPVLRTLEYL